jgi:hypothetical protein
MLVSDPHFAAQLVTSTGDHLYFDDVGCLATFALQRPATLNRAWVRAPNGSWVSTSLAHFDTGAKTPMDYGFTFSPSGKLDWKSLQAAVAQRTVAGGEP